MPKTGDEGSYVLVLVLINESGITTSYTVEVMVTAASSDSGDDEVDSASSTDEAEKPGPSTQPTIQIYTEEEIEADKRESFAFYISDASATGIVRLVFDEPVLVPNDLTVLENSMEVFILDAEDWKYTWSIIDL